MSQPTAPRPRLRLTRRGRLLRSGLVLLLIVLLLIAVISIVRALGDDAPGSATSPALTSSGPISAAPSDGGGGSVGAPATPAPPASEASGSPTPESEGGEAEAGDESAEMVRTGTVGDGTWAVAAPETAAPEATGTLHTYAVRVEGGTGIDADEAAAEIAAVLADPRGWQDLEEVAFQRVSSPEEAGFTISVASPPTVDELCLPARTGGVWSCRIGPDVALNSDRWLHATPTYEDLTSYRAYMINHEVGHFLGHGHASCGGEDALAPVMLQQSIDLQGCRPNAWPAAEA